MRQVILTLVTLALLGASAAALVVFLGLYNVSAKAGHWPGVSWVLHTTFRNSVELRSGPPAWVPADLGPERVALGAGHFDTACRICHARPDEKRSATIRSMVPRPPHISTVAEKWSPEELHWIVREGAKMTGMPAWPAARDDEVWALVAFLEALPEMSGEDYEALLGRDAPQADETPGQEAQVEKAPGAAARPSEAASLQAAAPGAPPAQALPVAAGGPEGLAYCATCHGRDGRSDNPFIPRLDIQTPEYLLHALETYADESRGSGFMLQAVSMVSPASLAELAAHYGAVAPEGGHGEGKGGEPERRDPGFAKKDVEPSLMAGPEPKEKLKGKELIARGRALAEGRAGDTRVPACTACHGPVETGQKPPAELEADFPALAGQHRTFLESQLILWRKSLRSGGKAAELMWQAARDLTDADISALSAYFASLPPQKLPVARGPVVVPR